MVANTPNFKIIYLNEIDSTNLFLKKIMKENEVEDCTVILADYQTFGRGQGSNSWHSERGQNITLSMLFKPEIKTLQHFSLSEFISLALIDLLNFYHIEAKIKWPNDIYSEDKKIAGILIENKIEADLIKYMIAGIGLNVNEENFPVGLPNAISMKTILKHSINRQILTNKLIHCILNRYKQLITGEYIPLHTEYNKILYKRNILTDYRVGDQVFRATLKDVGAAGELNLVNLQQKSITYLFGEVQMII